MVMKDDTRLNGMVIGKYTGKSSVKFDDFKGTVRNAEPSEWTRRVVARLEEAAYLLTEGCTEITRVRVTYALIEFAEQIRQSIEESDERR